MIGRPTTLTTNDIGRKIEHTTEDLTSEEITLGPMLFVLNDVAQSTIEIKPDVEIRHLLGQRATEGEFAELIRWVTGS